MMNFDALKDRLVADGYSDDTAYAKIAHDIVLKAVQDSGFHDNLTVKGGVVMSSLTAMARRSTMDMDFDFLRYSLTNDAIRKFVSRLNRVAPCKMRIVGKIETLRQQEYKGKRIHLSLTDENRLSIETKIDIGVHTRTDVEQTDLPFKVVTDEKDVVLLVNPKEQIFVEKQGGESRAKYGNGLIDSLAERLTAEFGPGFTRSNLRNMRQFYLMFPIRHTVCGRKSRDCPRWVLKNFISVMHSSCGVRIE